MLLPAGSATAMEPLPSTESDRESRTFDGSELVTVAIVPAELRLDVESRNEP